ncbi:MAG: HD domain-containing protein [Chloroflexota bacterium]|nr:HD domain-containing protein [Chloroflexota bacterium]
MTYSSVYLSESEAQQLYAGDDAAHDFDHVLRVTRLGERIAQAEGAAIEIVHLAALLHDVSLAGDGLENNARSSHHRAAAAFAQEWLTRRGLEGERVANVVHCIEAHRFRDQTLQPATLEAKCLYDADKLDSIGAIGVARAFAYAGRYGSRLWTTPARVAPPHAARPQGAEYTPVHEFVYKLQRLLETLHTPTARHIGAQRHVFMLAFFAQLDSEMQHKV